MDGEKTKNFFLSKKKLKNLADVDAVVELDVVVAG